MYWYYLGNLPAYISQTSLFRIKVCILIIHDQQQRYILNLKEQIMENFLSRCKEATMWNNLADDIKNVYYFNLFFKKRTKIIF